MSIAGFVELIVDEMIVHVSGEINGDGLSSYGSTSGPGTPSTPGCTWSTSDGRDRAASYGGVGGGASAGCLYGSTFFPSDMGSSGYTGKGGAALQLTVTGELVLNGTISMDGAQVVPTDRSGGSGGSAWITVGKLSGSGGVVTADGGVRDRYGDAAGGGGRIAVYCDESTYESSGSHGWALPSMHAYGGQGNGDDWDGGCGTVYVDCGSVTKALLLDNAGRDTTPQTTTLVDSGMTTYEFDEVVLRGTTKLSFAPMGSGPSTVTVSIGSTRGDGSGEPSKQAKQAN